MKPKIKSINTSEGNEQLMKAFIALLILIMAQGCVTTDESYRATRDPGYTQEVENQLKTPEDWERWHKLQKHNRNAFIILDES